MISADVYVNYGRFVADCPAEGCSDARAVEPGRRDETCAAGHAFGLAWHPDLPAVIAELGAREIEARRNWFPPDHPLAVRLGQPHGQTIEDLRAESEQGQALEAQIADDRRKQAAIALGELGLSIDADGKIKGL